MDGIVDQITIWEAPGELNLCTYLYNIDRNSLPNIISKIQHISFPYLKDLNLCLNEIYAVDQLCNIDFPNLEHLWLGN